jgi:CsoR family transcriptional regulator, copper-sensing transcriptional repressor
VDMADEGRVTRGYSATKPELVNRLARVEGQVRGVSRMVEEERYCIDVLTQIAAAQAALDKIALGLVNDHALHCMLGEGQGPEDPREQVDELMGAVGRLVRR